jgi:signal transduction histidine kinase
MATELTNTKKALDVLKADAKRLTDLASDVQDYSMSDAGKVMDGNAQILIRIHQRISMALRADGVVID